MSSAVPDKPSLAGLEEKWGARWEAAATFRFDRRAQRDQVYSIDTPPLTVSGSLHVGHVFSFTHTDTMARYKRMRGFQVFYPMGWDDNGLATERRVQNYFGVRCDPSLPYEAGFVPPAEGGLAKGQAEVAVSRPNFVELCERLVAEDEKAYEAVWRRLGLSVDWMQYYTTIGEGAQRASQRGFLRMLARGDAYSAEAPTLWDVDFQTAVAQAELEDRERPGRYYRLVFKAVENGAGEGGSELLIDTTRPELLPACVAVVVHPDDARFASVVGRPVRTPLFRVEVPVVAHPLAQPDKGTGAAMVCTFGDTTDVVWWRELGLPVRAVVGRDGRLVGSAPAGLDAGAAALYESELAGRTVRQAQTRLVELLAAAGELRGEARPVQHAVKFYEKGDRPLEIVTSRQWFFRTLALRPQLLERGRQLRWHPPYMQARYASWVEGLNTDWLISRQRFFGVPFPVWYRLDETGAPDYAHPLLPGEEELPVDPTTDVPAGYAESHRGRPGGFAADPDVMDTWATSSLTPQIAGKWEDDPDLFDRVWPMDLRPQAHDIIRTWLFATIVRSHLEFDSLPWSDAAISGWILDPDRKKMSKSKGNVVTPMSLLEQYGADSVRYWAASARPGTDTAFDEGQMRIGRKLAIKVLNASRFVLELGAGPVGPEDARAATAALTVGPGGSSQADALDPPEPLDESPELLDQSPELLDQSPELLDESPELLDESPELLDESIVAALAVLIDEATSALQGYDYARALERTEAFFWSFCDDYLELVKSRAYGSLGEGRARRARQTLRLVLSVLLRLLAPFLPYVTEEVWSWWGDPASGSIHRARWPSIDELGAPAAAAEAWTAASEVLGAIRKAKTEAGLSLRAPVASVRVAASVERLAWLQAAADDLREAGVVSDFSWTVAGNGADTTVGVDLA
jgi:valyl-tRNA synthetase